MPHIQILSKPHKQSLPSLHFPTPWSFLCLSLKNIIHLYSFLKDLFQKSLKTRKKKKHFFIRTTRLSLSNANEETWFDHGKRQQQNEQ
jgi:hypothetical protein